MPRATASNRFILKDIVSCLEFDNANTIVDVPANVAIDNIWDGGGALSIWIRPRTRGEDAQGGVMFYVATGATTAWIFQLWFGPGAGSGGGFGTRAGIRFFHNFSTTAGSWEMADPPQEFAPVKVNQWTHLAVSYNSDDVVNNPSIYVNGALQVLDELSTPVGTRTSDNGLIRKLGNRGGLDRTFDGFMYDFRLFSGSLTQAEVQDIYYRDVIPSGAVLVYRMNEGTGTTLSDSSGNGITGAITTGAWNTTLPPKQRLQATSRTQATSRVQAV